MVEQLKHIAPFCTIRDGSFFSDLWTERKVYSLIETHSSNILLRLRLIADANHPLKSGDVSVAFVDQQ